MSVTGTGRGCPSLALHLFAKFDGESESLAGCGHGVPDTPERAIELPREFILRR